MRIKKIVMGTVVAGGVGLASLGAGAGVASAAPQAPVQTHQQYVQSTPNFGAPVAQPGPVRRPDHQAFNYRGHKVTPTFDQHRHGWGFWFFGFWVPLAR